MQKGKIVAMNVNLKVKRAKLLNIYDTRCLYETKCELDRNRFQLGNYKI